MALLYFFAAPKTIYDCTEFLCRLQFILCHNGFWLQNNRFICNKWTFVYSLCCPALAVTWLGYIIHTKTTTPQSQASIRKADQLLVYITCLELILSTLMFLITSYGMQLKTKRSIKLYERLNALDECLIRDFGAKLNYHKLKRKNLVIFLLLTSGYVCAMAMAMQEMVSGGDFMLVYTGAMCYIFITFGPHFNGYMHMNLTEILRIRFRLLQKLLNQKYLLWRFPDPTIRVQRVHTAVEMILELHELVPEINDIFGTVLLIVMLHDFTLTTSEIYMMFGHSIFENTNYKLLLCAMFCMLGPLYKMISSPIYCDLAIAEGRNCLRAIEQIDNYFPRNVPVKSMVCQTLHWRLGNKIQFTTGLNIEHNRRVVALTLSTIINYLFVMIQFRFTQKMGAEMETQTNIIQNWIGDVNFTELNFEDQYSSN